MTRNRNGNQQSAALSTNLLFHVDDPAVGPEAGQQEAGVVRVLGGLGGEVVEDPGDVQQRPGDRPRPGPARSLLQPPVERGARGQGLQSRRAL